MIFSAVALPGFPAGLLVLPAAAPAVPTKAVPPQLYKRTLDKREAIPLPGTEGATNPFLSPDGQWTDFLRMAS